MRGKMKQGLEGVSEGLIKGAERERKMREAERRNGQRR